MADWILVPSLVALRGEINAIAPDRSKTSDGSIGDTAHQQTSSDHNPDETGTVPIIDADKINEVHAIDVDKDLNEPDLTMEKVVQFLLNRCRSGAEGRLRYIIYNRRIWSASKDWIQQTYTGPNPHTEHAHFSASYVTAREASTASWHLEELVAITDAEIERIATAVEKKVWNHTEADPANPGGTRRVGGELRMMEYRANARAQTEASSHAAILNAIGQLAAPLAEIKGAVQALDVLGEDDRAAIVQGILAGMSPELAKEVAEAALAEAGRRLSGEAG